MIFSVRLLPTLPSFLTVTVTPPLSSLAECSTRHSQLKNKPHAGIMMGDSIFILTVGIQDVDNQYSGGIMYRKSGNFRVKKFSCDNFLC